MTSIVNQLLKELEQQAREAEHLDRDILKQIEKGKLLADTYGPDDYQCLSHEINYYEVPRYNIATEVTQIVQHYWPSLPISIRDRITNNTYKLEDLISELSEQFNRSVTEPTYAHLKSSCATFNSLVFILHQFHFGETTHSQRWTVLRVEVLSSLATPGFTLSPRKFVDPVFPIRRPGDSIIHPAIATVSQWCRQFFQDNERIPLAGSLLLSYLARPSNTWESDREVLLDCVSKQLVTLIRWIMAVFSSELPSEATTEFEAGEVDASVGTVVIKEDTPPQKNKVRFTEVDAKYRSRSMSLAEAGGYLRGTKGQKAGNSNRREIARLSQSGDLRVQEVPPKKFVFDIRDIPENVRERFLRTDRLPEDTK